MLVCCSELLSWHSPASMSKSTGLPFADVDFNTQSSQERIEGKQKRKNQMKYHEGRSSLAHIKGKIQRNHLTTQPQIPDKKPQRNDAQGTELIDAMCG